MKVYRIAKTGFINDLGGEGARLFGGRWNFKGYPVLYTTTSRSLAVLENLVHVSNVPGAGEYSLLTLNIPVSVKPLNINETGISKSQLKRFYEVGSTTEIMVAGTQWLIKQSSLLLRVPSAVIFEEDNILINPLHPDFVKIKKAGVRVFEFDKRLFYSKI